MNRTENPSWNILMEQLTDLMCMSQCEFNLLVSASTSAVPGCGVLLNRPLDYGSTSAWLSSMTEEQLRLVGRVLAYNRDQTHVALQKIRESNFAYLFGL